MERLQRAVQQLATIVDWLERPLIIARTSWIPPSAPRHTAVSSVGKEDTLLVQNEYLQLLLVKNGN